MTALKQQQDALLFETRRLEEVSRLAERRMRIRLTCCYAARVSWLDKYDGNLRQEAILDNLSSNGLYMRVRHNIPAGQKLFIVFYMADAMKLPSNRLCSAMTHSVSAPRIAVRGSVLRVEALSNGLWGVAIVFNQHRFL